MAASENGLSTRTKDQKSTKPNAVMDETTEENNEMDSKSDSDKLVGTVAASNRNSIYANQRQRRQEAAAAYRKKLEEMRQLKASGNPQATSSDRPRAVLVKLDSRPASAAAISVGPQDVANRSADSTAIAQASCADSGYMTRKELVPPSSLLLEVLTHSVKHSETIPPGKSTAKLCAMKPKSSIPVPVGLTISAPPPPPPSISPAPENDNYFVINCHPYRILNQIGKGGSSQVYQVYDEERKLCLAVKRVDLSDADDMVVIAYRNEIALLKRLQKYPDRVVRMYDYEYLENEQRLYVVMEKGDTDLASLFKSRQDNKLPDQMIAFYWLEMLKAVQVIHQEGIVHSDLKPANFLLVAGNLKLIDFGIANAVPANKTSVTRECHMGTLNYMSPEAISCAESGGMDEMKQRVGVKSDVWSLGCMLYTMVYGKTPFQDIRNPLKKMASVLDRRHVIPFPPVGDMNVISVMKRCLERDPKRRASIDELLKHPYCKSYSAGDGPSTSSNDDNLRALAETVSKMTPRTGARVLKAAISQMKGTSGDMAKSSAKEKLNF